MGLDWTNRISFREYSVCCIRKIWVDWPGTGLPIFPNPCFGPDELGLCLGCYGGDTGMARSPLRFWAGEWDTWPIFLSLSQFK